MIVRVVMGMRMPVSLFVGMGVTVIVRVFVCGRGVVVVSLVRVVVEMRMLMVMVMSVGVIMRMGVVMIGNVRMSLAEAVGVKGRVGQLALNVELVITQEEPDPHTEDEKPGAAFEDRQIGSLNLFEIGQGDDAQDVDGKGVGEGDDQGEEDGMENGPMRTHQIGRHDGFPVSGFESVGRSV